MKTVFAFTPSHKLDATIAIAAARAGALGVLDLGYRQHISPIRGEIKRLRDAAAGARAWGVRWDTLGLPDRDLDHLARLLPFKPPVLVIGGREKPTSELLKAARELVDSVIIEVSDTPTAVLAEEVGFDGLVANGNEVGGSVSKTASFILAQELRGRVRIPYWIRGGVGPRVAAAVTMAGAKGWVLAEQLWLSEEGPWFVNGKKTPDFDGSESVILGRDNDLFRVSARHGRSKVKEVELVCARGEDWRSFLVQKLADENDPIIPLGQDIALAASLARRYGTAGRIIDGLQSGVEEKIREAAELQPFAPDSALARAHGVRYPILQGPMTRVSDVAPFTKSVSDAGALPFLALAVMPGAQARGLLLKAKELMAGRAWGVGMLGFLPLELRQAQREAIREVKPPYAIIAGGRPSQAREMEELGVTTYLHVPSPALLRGFISEGARKYIFEGAECGGHTGPRSSFILWESAIEVLLDSDLKDPESFRILFAGGIHDQWSAAMVSILAAPLVARGMSVGVLMGTAYLFTEEAVKSGAVTQGFQDEALNCSETALLQSGVGIYTRCAKTAFCDEFDSARRELVLKAKSENEILMALELLNIGRLRIASKGVVRNDSPDNEGRYRPVDLETQRRDGLYMMGEVARLRSEKVTMASLHESVTVEAGIAIEAAARAHQKPANAPRSRAEPVAVVGMACLLPKAGDLKTYWRNILLGVNAIREVPLDRWRPEDFYDPNRGVKDKVYSKWGGFLDDISFEPAAYGIPPASLSSIEPIQLLALHVSKMALEDAGFDHRPFPRDRTATIFATGAMNDLGTEYVFRTLLPKFLPRVEGISSETAQQIISSLYAQDLPTWTSDSFPGFLANVVAGRVANRLDLNGSNFTVDAACAAGLAALEVGVRQLRDRSADVALVGAVDATNGPVGFMSFAQTMALSPRGRCRPFDESADGIALGEGVAAVVLRRLSDAERDGDHIYAVIKGVGSSSDGRSRTLTAPSPTGQVLALERAYADADVDIGTVTMIEAHGTGTAMGDKSEIESLALAFSGSDARKKSCAVGSVKSMIGHTKITAGLASVIKASLALDQKVLPPTIGVERPLSQFDDSPFYVNSESRPWITRPANEPRRCGVSAFGFGGTNFHAVLEEYQGEYRECEVRDLNARAAEIFEICRSTREDLENAAAALLRSASQKEQPSLAQLAFSSYLDEAKARPKNGGALFSLFVVATSGEDLKVKLQSFLQAPSRGGKLPSAVYFCDRTHLDRSGKVCLLFPGQGSQQVNMLRDLVTSRRSSHALFDRADDLLSNSISQPLSSYIFPPPVLSKAEQDSQKSELNNTRIAQPALAVVELAAYDLLHEFGLRPHFLAGHSFGEYVALCIAGAMSRDELIQLADARGRIASQAARDQKMAMAAVNTSESRVEELVAKHGLAVAVASLNAPDQTIIAGPSEAIDDAIKAFDQISVRATRLAVTAAFHTKAMAGSRGALEKALENVDFKAPATPVFSNTTAALFPDEPQAIRALLGRHLVEPLRFVEEIQQLYEAGARVFIECGPGLVLSRLTDSILGNRPHSTLTLDVAGRPGWLQFAHLLGQCVALGLPVDIGRWFRNRGLAPISVAESLQRAKAQANPSQLAWRINGGRAEPWHVQKSSAKAVIEHKETATVSPIPPDRKQTPASSPASQRPANTEVSHKIDRRLKVSSEDQIKSVAPSEALSSVTRSPPPLGTDIQANLASLIDLQRRQQETLWRFMEFQENLLGVGMPRPAHSSLTLPAAPAASVGALAKPTTPTQNAIALDFQQTAVEPPATVSKRATPPTPVLPKFVASPSSVQPQIKVPTSNGAGPSTAAKRIAEPVSRGLDAGPVPILPPTEQFKKELVRVVAERTGYSEEMLDLDAHVEADLGIDSIKRIEIFSTLKDDYPFMEGRDQETVFEELSNLKTLNAVVSWYDSLRSNDNKGGPGPGKKTLTPSQLLPEATESTNLQAAPHDARRYAVIPISAPLGADMKKELLPKDRILLVIGLPDTLRDPFVEGLRSRNCDFVAVRAGQETKLIDENDAEVNFSDLNGVQTLRNLLREKGKIVGALANFAVSEGQSAQFGLARRLFVLLKAFEVDLRSYKRGSWLLNVTAMDGQFGLRRAQRFDVLPAGTLGVAKTLAIEWPEVMVKCVDIDSKIDPQLSVEQVLKEIASGNLVTEVGFTSDGRFTLDLKSDDSEEESLAGLRLEEESVLLVTGGAYGITADIVKAFAKKFKPIIILTGRSRLPEPEGPETLALRSSAELKKFLIESMRARDPKTKPVEIERALTRILRDREIADNLAAMRDAGARVEYHSIDLRDEGGFSQLIQSIYARHGRIDGVLHGAGVIDDKLIKDKQVESFDNVFSTKVIPATVLVKNLKPETLKFFVFFSSIAGRFGNAGQSDYSAANEVINKLAGLLRVDWPHVQTVAINWGPWDGGMVKPELRAFFAQREIFPITLEQGTRRCLEELQHGASGPSEVVVASSLNEIVELTTLSKHRTPANLVT